MQVKIHQKENIEAKKSRTEDLVLGDHPNQGLDPNLRTRIHEKIEIEIERREQNLVILLLVLVLVLVLVLALVLVLVLVLVLMTLQKLNQPKYILEISTFEPLIKTFGKNLVVLVVLKMFTFLPSLTLVDRKGLDL